MLKKLWDWGSSPRVRGEEFAVCRVEVCDGIIPAGAGRRMAWRPRGSGRWDHPRGCGEKSSGARTPRPLSGSSPRVRGEGEFAPGGASGLGIIPAGAGRRAMRARRRARGGDHPRGCGEKRPDAHYVGPAVGSSPRVRGEVAHLSDLRFGHSIIPAGAGRSELRRRLERKVGDHPRGCGEKPLLLRRDGRAEGSSPRVRGEATSMEQRYTASGIIPAGAGRSHKHGAKIHGLGDHPRGCGEKSRRQQGRRGGRGSSPRVRGEAGPGPMNLRKRGIIPAGAGRRPTWASRSRRRVDHPRGCGEKPFTTRE